MYQRAEKFAGKFCCGWLLQVQLSIRAFWANSSLQSQGLAADTLWQQTRSSFGLVQVAQPAPSYMHLTSYKSSVEMQFVCHVLIMPKLSVSRYMCSICSIVCK